MLNLIISLETVFIYGNEDKSKSISSKVSALIANPGYEEFISEFLKEIYINRSKIVHSGIVYISKDELNTAYELYKKNQYGKYLKDVMDGKFIDQ